MRIMKLKNKKIITVIALAVIGILLIFAGNKHQSFQDNQDNSIDYKSYTKELEKKLEEFLLSIDGINKANVIITLENSSEQVYAQNQTTYDFLTINSENGESPVYITEIYPTVRGVAIACTNGNNDEIKVKVTNLITAYLGISSNRIEIVGIK